MEPNAILKADPLDLIFDNRNKNYGAYTLRKYYDRRLAVSLALSVSAGLALFCFLGRGPQPLLVTDFFLPPEVVVHTEAELVKIKPKITVIPRRTVPVATVANPVYRIVPDDKADKITHTIEELAKARIGVTDIPGPAETGIAPAGQVTSAGSETNGPEKMEVPQVYRTADVMPQYPGGQEALMRFLNRNLRMPEGAEAGTKVSVLATFVVGADGKVKQAEMSRSGGERFDAEVKRVIAKMPAWIPGRVGNRSVAVYFTLPVQFVVPEE